MSSLYTSWNIYSGEVLSPGLLVSRDRLTYIPPLTPNVIHLCIFTNLSPNYSPKFWRQCQKTFFSFFNPPVFKCLSFFLFTSNLQQLTFIFHLNTPFYLVFCFIFLSFKNVRWHKHFVIKAKHLVFGIKSKNLHGLDKSQ